MTDGFALEATRAIAWNWHWITPASGIVAMGVLCYLAGRLQQYARGVDDREQAYVQGYNTATQALFSLATRATVQAVDAPPLLEQRRRLPKTYRPGRHAVDTGDLSTLQETARFATWEERKAA